MGLAFSDALEIQPVSEGIHGRVRPPGSKSITNRALVCAALADGPSTLTGALRSEDTQVMAAALRSLGVKVDMDLLRSAFEIEGCGGVLSASQADLDLSNSGTSIRFLTALATLGHGVYRLDGKPRMRLRPIGDLIAALNQLGADVRASRVPAQGRINGGLPRRRTSKSLPVQESSKPLDL